MAEPDPARLLDGAAARALSYLSGLEARAVAPTTDWAITDVDASLAAMLRVARARGALP